MRRICAAVGVWVALAVGWVAPAAAGAPYEIPAYWVVEGDTLQPRVGDFAFNDLAFVASDEGWIVGDRFLLHISGPRVRVVFVNDVRTSLVSVATLGPTAAWAGGLRAVGDDGGVEGVLWSYGTDGWRPALVPEVPVVDWTVARVRVAAANDGAALVHGRAPASTERRDVLLHFDGTRWSVAFAAPAGSELSDVCLTADGSGWAVGRKMVAPRAPWQGAAWRRDGRIWSELRLPVGLDGEWDLHRVCCLSGGQVAAVGGRTTPTATGPAVEGLLLRFDGAWRRVELPEPMRAGYPDALDAAPDGSLWVAAGRAGRPRIARQTATGGWDDTALPVLPGGRRRGFAVGALALTAASEGWAIADDVGGPGVVRGLVLRYRDGAWSNRGWNWHFWRERWFGLFGH
jgi:hypothetical protein